MVMLWRRRVPLAVPTLGRGLIRTVGQFVPSPAGGGVMAVCGKIAVSQGVHTHFEMHANRGMSTGAGCQLRAGMS